MHSPVTQLIENVSSASVITWHPFLLVKPHAMNPNTNVKHTTY